MKREIDSNTVVFITAVMLVIFAWIMLGTGMLEVRITHESEMCQQDCLEFGYNNSKWESGGFSSNNCWCYSNNTATQIW